MRPLVATAFPASFWLGGTVLLRGAVAPAHPGAAIVVERLLDGRVAVRSARPPSVQDSHFAFRWTPDAFGYYRLRARMEADADHDTGVSRGKLVTVNRPNAHDVPMRYAHYIVIVRHEYRLYYYEHGVLVRRFDVALGRPGYRTPLGYFHVYGKRKPAGGALGACAMYYRHLGGIAIHGTNQPYLISRLHPARLLARLRAHAEPSGALAVRSRAGGDARSQSVLSPAAAGLARRAARDVDSRPARTDLGGPP